MSSYVASIEAFGRKQKKQIEKVTLIDNRPEPRKTFVMTGLKQHTPVKEWAEPEILPELPDEDFIPVSATGYGKTLNQRY